MRNILFVGAPFGGFFRALAAALEQRGARVWRIVCDGGEFVATPAANRVVFRGRRQDWPGFVRNVMRDRRISTLVTYNDSCWRTSAAHKVADDCHAARLVLEQGYLRPWWVTFDREGVNGNTLLPPYGAFYLDRPAATPAHTTFAHSLRYVVRDTILHFAAAVALSPALPLDRTYWGDDIWRQAAGYVRAYAWRKFRDERALLRRLVEHKTNAVGPIFTVLLQKPGDAQIKTHSRYDGNEPFLREVLHEFAAHAPPNAFLAVKQHPLDYGVENTPRVFDRLTTDLAIADRALYVRTLPIEQMLDISDGLVTINSTGGLAAIERGIPTIALGRAIYDMPGLTFQGGLDSFFVAPRPPDGALVSAFINYLKCETQVNGGFHTPSARALLVKNLARRLCTGFVAPHHELAPARVTSVAVPLAEPLAP